jgi:hypothetical protein
MFRKPFSADAGTPATAVLGEALRACRPGARRRRRMTDAALLILVLMRDLQQHRGLSSAVLSGRRDVRDDCEAVGEKLQRSLVAASDPTAGWQELFGSLPWQQIMAGWESLRHGWRGLDFHTNLTVHSALVLDLVGILCDVADTCREAIGERQSRVISEWPPMVEHLAMLRALGLHLIAEPAGFDDARLRGTLKTHLHEARSTLAATADLLDGSSLYRLSDEAVAAVVALRDRVHLSADPRGYHSNMTRAIDAWYAQIRKHLGAAR